MSSACTATSVAATQCHCWMVIVYSTAEPGPLLSTRTQWCPLAWAPACHLLSSHSRAKSVLLIALYPHRVAGSGWISRFSQIHPSPYHPFGLPPLPMCPLWDLNRDCFFLIARFQLTWSIKWDLPIFFSRNFLIPMAICSPLFSGWVYLASDIERCLC